MLKPEKPILCQWPQFPVWHTRASVSAAGLVWGNDFENKEQVQNGDPCLGLQAHGSCRSHSMGLGPSCAQVLTPEGDSHSRKHYFTAKESACWDFFMWGVGSSCPAVAILNCPWIVQGPLPNLICCGDSCNGRVLSVQRWAWCRLEK